MCDVVKISESSMTDMKPPETICEFMWTNSFVIFDYFRKKIFEQFLFFNLIQIFTNKANLTDKRRKNYMKFCKR